jgi:protein disulfide-isomerase-like protein
LVEFYAPWCSICQKLAPTYEDAADELHKVGSKLKLAKIDGTTNKIGKEKYGVKGFPEIFFFRGGHSRVYEGGRSLEDFVTFGQEMDKPETSDENSSTIDKIFETNVVTFLYAGPAKEKELFKEVARKQQGLFKFITTSDNILFTKYGIAANQPTIIAFVEQGEFPQFSGPWVEGKIMEFINEHKLPWLNVLSPKTFKSVAQDANRLTVYGVIDVSIDNTEFRNMLIKLAKKFRSEYVFATVDELA